MRIDYSLIPALTLDSITAYVSHRRPVGGFLTAVFEHDLFEAVGRADENNLRALRHIVAYIYNEVPSVCHGSRERVDAWLSPPKPVETEQCAD